MARTRSARTKGNARPQNRPRAVAGGGRPGQPGPAQVRPRPSRPQGNGQATMATAQAAPASARAAASARPGTASGPPRWLRLTTLVLSAGGLGVSIYLTIAHYTAAVSLACPDTGAINCQKVTTSPESAVAGIPVAVLGLAFFVFMLAATSPLAWRARIPLLPLARVLSVVAGMGFVLYLIYVELFRLNAICLWCTSVHVITFALFVLILFAAAMWGVRDDARKPA